MGLICHWQSSSSQSPQTGLEMFGHVCGLYSAVRSSVLSDTVRGVLFLFLSVTPHSSLV